MRQVLFKESLLVVAGDVDSRILLKEGEDLRRRVQLKKGRIGEQPERPVRDDLHLAPLQRKGACARDGQRAKAHPAFSRPLHLQFNVRQFRANLQWPLERILIRAEKEWAARKQREQRAVVERRAAVIIAVIKTGGRKHLDQCGLRVCDVGVNTRPARLVRTDLFRLRRELLLRHHARHFSSVLPRRFREERRGDRVRHDGPRIAARLQTEEQKLRRSLRRRA